MTTKLYSVDDSDSASQADHTTAGPLAENANRGIDGVHCPFCTVAAGGNTLLNTQGDIVRQNEHAIALISPRWWPRNRGHVLVVSRSHYESLYELPREHGHAVQDLVQEIAIAVRNSYHCQGTSIRQHNEPAGGQDVPHYHVHVFPRFLNDDLYTSQPLPGFATTTERAVYAADLRDHLRN